jgi:integrase/recombinase XerD
MASFVSGPVIGPLAPFAEGFAAQLANLSYSTQAVKSHRGLLVQLSQWLAERGLSVRELTPEVSAKFLQMRRDAGLVTKVSDRGLQPLLSYLRELGELGEPTVIRSPLEELVD